MTQPVQTMKSIMVIDDEPGRLRLISLFLKRAGYLPLAVHSARSALESLAVFIPDLFVISAGVDNEKGLELCRQIRKSPPTAEAPLLVITMHGDDTGFHNNPLIDATLSIPFVSHALIEQIDSMLTLQEAN
jgi:two-component system, NtrC family, response regulator GlrR